ncbi:glycosyltransferase family 2 protein [Prevotella stercorea]|uniref:glycosyltransferase family 2 protein n=1 Tax=Leyella stercorea TaxID=363265 RepID=UPI001F2E5DBF|nr:glycosyltransferase family 2 protein [Leyella stercorea]MCF2644219.1 glycosyltransferase family 2 protein [Leyella stercorea]
MVTIVIPCYNVAKYIKRCIDSLVDQSFQKFKVILVDDKSTDDTYQYLLQLQATSGLDIMVLQNSCNSGPAVSRNKGILEADTKYITFCDSDDWYEPDFLKTMVSLLEDNAADMAFCGYKVVDEHGNSQSRPVYNRSGLISREEAFCLDADSLCMLMVKTDIMKDTLLPDLRNGEDVATVPLLMAKANRYAATVSCLYNYFRRSDSASERPTMKAVESLVCSYRYVQENFPDEYIKEKEFLGIKNLLYSTIITLFSCSNDKRTAKELLNEFETIYPNWKNNLYITSLRIYKKVILRMVSLKLFGVVRLVAILRNVIFR